MILYRHNYQLHLYYSIQLFSSSSSVTRWIPCFKRHNKQSTRSYINLCVIHLQYHINPLRLLCPLGRCVVSSVSISGTKMDRKFYLHPPNRRLLSKCNFLASNPHPSIHVPHSLAVTITNSSPLMRCTPFRVRYPNHTLGL